MITPLSSHTGAEVTGVDLTQPVDAALREHLNRAFVEHSVLVFRDQHLSPPQLLAAVQLFGEVFPQHNTRFALPECPQIHTISNQDFYPDGKRYIPGEGWHTEQAVSREDALKMFTIWPAYAAFQEDVKGTIEPGKLADLTVLSADIMKIPAPEILNTRCEMTVIGGEIVYQR